MCSTTPRPFVALHRRRVQASRRTCTEGPPFARGRGGVSQPEPFGRGTDRRDILLEEAAHEQVAARAQRRGIGPHVGREDVAVDVRHDEVVGAARDAAHVAQHRRDAVRDAVGGDVLAAVGIGPVVDVHGVDVRRAALCRDDRQHARAAAHVEARAALQLQVEQRPRHEPRRGVVSRAERHFGHEHHLGLARGRRLVEGRADAQPPLDIDPRKFCSPEGVPVLRLDGDVAAAAAVAPEQRIDLVLAVGEGRSLADVGLQHARPSRSLEGVVGQLGREDLRLFGVRNRNLKRDVIHGIIL